MTPSLRLLLEDYLGLMREEGELDVYLPLLLSAMGHELVYRAQKGTRQYGVDISSIGKDGDGKKKLFLWLVKCGDIGRRDWDSGQQSIRQSINDVSDTYLGTHIAPQHARLPKKLVVLTNGDFNPALSVTIAAYLKSWSARYGVEADTYNGSTLAAWTERYLLDEHVLPPGNRALLRRMLANVGAPELSVSVGRTLIEELVKGAKKTTQSAAARRKRQLTALRGIRTALSVLKVWAQNESNQVAPYRLAEFAVLCVWAGLHKGLQQGDRNVAREFAELLLQMAGIAEAYHEVAQPYYVTQNAFATALPDSLLVTDFVFKELGRLGLQGCIWAFHAVEGKNTVAEELADVYVNRILALLTSHACSQSPAYDHHSVDIHVALLLLVIGNRRTEAKQWLHNLAVRLGHVARAPKYWPSSAPFEDVLAAQHGYEEMSEESRSTSTLLPLLLLWTAVLGMKDTYLFIKDTVLPAVPKTTPNFWSSDAGFDDLVADPSALQQHGVGEAVLNVPAEPGDFLSTMLAVLPGVESIEQADWYRLRAAYIPLLAALHWRLQVPREMLVKHAMAAAGHGANVATTANSSG
jgi:hypothetical protein